MIYKSVRDNNCVFTKQGMRFGNWNFLSTKLNSSQVFFSTISIRKRECNWRATHWLRSQQVGTCSSLFAGVWKTYESFERRAQFKTFKSRHSPSLKHYRCDITTDWIHNIQGQQIKQPPRDTWDTKCGKADQRINFSYLNFVTFYELFHFGLAEQHELLVLHHLREMLLGEKLGGLHQLKAIVGFGEVTNPQTVGRIKLTLQKITTCSFHPWGKQIVHRHMFKYRRKSDKKILSSSFK